MKLVGIEKIAEMLDVSVKTIYDWTSRDYIPHRKLGRLVKFDIDEIEAWVETLAVRPHQVYNRVAGGRSQTRR